MEGLKKERFFVYNVNTNKDAGYVLRISGVSDKYGEISMYHKNTTDESLLRVSKNGKKGQSIRIEKNDRFYKLAVEDEELRLSKVLPIYLYHLKDKYKIKVKKRTLTEENTYLKEIVKKLKQKSDEDDEIIEKLNQIIKF